MLNDKMLGEFLPKFKLGMIVSRDEETEYEDGRNELHRYRYINICQVSKT